MPRRPNKRKYFQQKGPPDQKRFRREELAPGMTGFLISCSKGNETRTVLESYDLLNEYMDIEMARLDLDQTSSSVPVPNATEAPQEPESDMEKAMEDELKSWRSNAGIEERKARFKAVESGCSNMVFISSAVTDPTLFAHSILKDIHEGKKGKARYIQRMLPVVASCRVDIDSVKKTGRKVLEKYFSSKENPSFLILYKTRNSASSLTRDDIIAAFGAIVKEINPECRAKLDDPDLAISVDIVKTVCCISVVKDYAKLKKYNVHVEEEVDGTDSRVGNSEAGKSVTAADTGEEKLESKGAPDSAAAEQGGSGQASAAEAESAEDQSQTVVVAAV